MSNWQQIRQTQQDRTGNHVGPVTPTVYVSTKAPFQIAFDKGQLSKDPNDITNQVRNDKVEHEYLPQPALEIFGASYLRISQHVSFGMPIMLVRNRIHVSLSNHRFVFDSFVYTGKEGIQRSSIARIETHDVPEERFDLGQRVHQMDCTTDTEDRQQGRNDIDDTCGVDSGRESRTMHRK